MAGNRGRFQRWTKGPYSEPPTLFIRLKREACKLGQGGSERRSAERESDHFLTKRRRSDSVFTFTRFAAVIKHNVERILIAKHVLKADHGR